MIKTNRNVLTFSSIILISGVFLVTVLLKIAPLLSHTVYYCQSFIQSLSIPIPSLFSKLLFILFILLLLIAIMKIAIVLFRVHMLKRSLMKHVTSQKKMKRILTMLALDNKTFLITSTKPFAFCLGITRPKIYISTKMISLMNNMEIEAILRHEKYHLENKDTFVMLLASIGESLYPFFPLLSDLLYNYRIDREVKADNKAIKELGQSASIISVIRKLLLYPSFTTVPISAIADQDTLEHRIKAIIKNDFHFKKYKVQNILISFISIVILFFILLAPVHAIDFHDERNDVMMLCPNGASCAKWCVNNKSISPPQSSKLQYSKESASQLYSPMHR